MFDQTGSNFLTQHVLCNTFIETYLKQHVLSHIIYLIEPMQDVWCDIFGATCLMQHGWLKTCNMFPATCYSYIFDATYSRQHVWSNIFKATCFIKRMQHVSSNRCNIFHQTDTACFIKLIQYICLNRCNMFDQSDAIL